MKPEKNERLIWLEELLSTPGAVIEWEQGGLLFLQGSYSVLKNIPKKFTVLVPNFFQEKFLSLNVKNSFVLEKNFFYEFLSDLELNTKQKILRNQDSIYEQDFQELKKQLNQDFQKAVLISREEFKPDHVIQFKIHLLKKSLEVQEGLTFGFWTEKQGMIGATPEILYQRDGMNFSTMALAGTRPIEKKKELLEDSKEKIEHEIVIKDIAEKIAPMTDQLKVGKTSIADFRNLSHLKTPMTATLKHKVTDSDLISALSPTAALGGYPFKKALDFIRGSHYHQQFPERFYGSSLCVSQQHETRSLVMIRGVQWENEKFFLENGGGIVEASTFSNELKEVHLKRNSIKKHYL